MRLYSNKSELKEEIKKTNGKYVVTGSDIYRIVSVISLILVGVLFVVDIIVDIGEHSFPQLLALCLVNTIISFTLYKKK